ncbi:hypothetical protein PG991_007099 [Apiospora marii]|uniref:Uncharacterized protein n=1 Tax=Apiospora marii TaxID=335849 RepID=A0ABR1RSE6_9PEZI
MAGSSSNPAGSNSDEKRLFPGARDRVKQWRKLNRRWRANHEKIIQEWQSRSVPLRRGLLRTLWLRNKTSGGKGKAKVVNRLPRDSRADLEGIVPWRAKDGKAPTAKSMLAPRAPPKDMDGWKASWKPDRTKMLFPFMAADPPSEYSAWDEKSVNMQLKKHCGYIQQVTTTEELPDWVDLTDRDPNNYGEESDVKQKALQTLAAQGIPLSVLGPGHPMLVHAEAEQELLCISGGLIPGKQAPLPLEVQEALYDFLLDVCEELAGKDASKDEEEESSQDGDGEEPMPDAEAALKMGKAVRALDTPWRTGKPSPGAGGSEIRRYLQSHREGAPFTSPAEIDLDFLEHAVHDRLRAIENDLLDMREDPGYFARKMQENREHHWRQVKPVTRTQAGMTNEQKETLKILHGNVNSLTLDHQMERQSLERWLEDNYRTSELKAAIVQRIITYEVWSNCFRYVTELRENWDEYQTAESQTGQFPPTAKRYLKLLSSMAMHMMALGMETPAKIHLPCDQAMRGHYERVTATSPFEVTFRDNTTASSDLQKLACMLWVVQNKGLALEIGRDNITEDMAEIVEKDANKFSDLSKGFMADFRAARDVGMEVNKFLMRHTDNCFLSPHSLEKDSPEAEMFMEWEKPMLALLSNVKTEVASRSIVTKRPVPPSDWFPLVESAEKAEAPEYSYTSDHTVKSSRANRQAERRLKTFWDALEAMLEKKGALPAETKALFDRARPLRTPRVTVDPPAKAGGKRKLPDSESTGGVSKKTKTGKSLSALNIAAAAAAAAADAADDSEAPSSIAGPSGTQTSPQEATFVDFSAGVGVVDAPRRPALEERRQKEKTRGVPDPTKEPVRAPEGQAPASERQIPVSKRAMDTLTLLLGPYTENQPVPWDEVLHMMASIGFAVRTTKTGGSQRIFEPTDYLRDHFGVRQSVGQHAPHPQTYHYLQTMRDWARDRGYGLAKLGWTLDTFKLEGEKEEGEEEKGEEAD